MRPILRFLLAFHFFGASLYAQSLPEIAAHLDWKMRSFGDTPASATEPTVIKEKTRSVSSGETIELYMAPGGGHVAIFNK